MLFVPPAQLKAETLLAAIDTIAISPNSKSRPHTCPFTMVSGLLPTLRPHAYGQVGLCYSKRLDQPDLRSEWCVYLGLESNSPGHHRVFIPARGMNYSRRRFDPQSGYPSQWNYPPRVTTHPSRVLTTADQELDALRADASEASATLNQPLNPAMEHPNARLPPWRWKAQWTPLLARCTRSRCPLPPRGTRLHLKG